MAAIRKAQHVECVYDDRRSKPGLRTGAVENLSQRVATLENMFLGQGVLWQQVFNALSTATHHSSTSPSQEESSNTSLNETAASLKNTLATLAEGGEPAMATLAAWRPKNPETQTTAPKENIRANAKLDSVFDDSLLPEADLVDNLVEIYFANIHPWIPMLHVRQFRERMLDPEQRPQLSTIFHAIVSLCARFSQDARLGSPEEKTRLEAAEGPLHGIATGWNFSLTSADVKRRLPCEGALWEAGKPLQTPTPYFGVADQSSGATGTLPSARPEEAAQDSLGGFAYCIEATESLSLVTSFFLQQAIDVSKPHEIQVWLMKFKQLDLRLVQWKIFLPEQWREACVLNNDGIMDPNLSLAHVTHNTAVVLLHQGIAYPLPEWQSTRIRLPSASSSETCLTAATEVAIIAEKFLQDSQHVVSPQFAFCLFICGRMFLAHSLYYSVTLPRGFDSLVGSLRTIAKRWNGPGDTSENLASKFAGRLVQARQQGHGMLDIRQAVYSDDRHETSSPLSGNSLGPPGAVRSGAGHPNNGFSPRPGGAYVDGFGASAVDFDQEASPDSISMAFPPLPLAFHAQNPSRGPTAMPSPVPANLQSHLSAYDHYDMEVPNGQGPNMVGEFEDLNAYLDYSFLPNQRVSMFSGAAEKE
ncbi:Citrinin biosynthesis transcriptional activator ctnR [Colletotrichum sp. SAR 10_98]|nr:Citrinin biosynthesis transcriptional activator ctnR [Colletotrichum sp. SAR 10_98]